MINWVIIQQIYISLFISLKVVSPLSLMLARLLASANGLSVSMT